jgi:hypothetical protein
MRTELEKYYLTLSEHHGDNSDEPDEVARDFTVGFCVVMEKPAQE